MINKIEVLHPEWLPGAIESTERCFRLYKQGKLPEVLVGWMLVVDCLRILRCIFGDDLSTAISIRKIVLDKIKSEQEVSND